jgi:hypothetical protein
MRGPVPPTLAQRKRLAVRAGVAVGVVMLAIAPTVVVQVPATAAVVVGRESMGAPAGSLSTPAVASWGYGHLDLFVVGDGRLWQRIYEGGWTGWVDRGAPDGVALNSAPAAVSWGPGRIDVVATGTDTSVWHLGFEGGAPQGWWPLSGPGMYKPTVASQGSGKLDVFALDSLSQLRMRSYTHATGWQPDWTPLGGTLYSAPSAAGFSRGVAIFAKAGDGYIYGLHYDNRYNSWSGWSRFSTEAPVNAGPAAIYQQDGARAEVFSLGARTEVRRRISVIGDPGWFGTVFSLRPTVWVTPCPKPVCTPYPVYPADITSTDTYFAPVAAFHPGHIDLFYTLDGAVQHAWWG